MPKTITTPNSQKKVSIVGCGKVGMTIAYALLLQGSVNELVLFGRHKDKLMGEKMDLDHGLAFLGHSKIIASDDYQDLVDSDLVIIAAGIAQKQGETRLDVADKNSKMIEEIIPKIVKVAPNSVILIVSNPVDVLTYRAYKVAGLAKGKIFGSGTTLDTSRFRFHLGEFLNVNPRSIHAYILGEHGDSSFPVMSSATIGGQLMTTFANFSFDKALKAYEIAKNAAYKIIDAKGATYYAIGVVAAKIAEAILRDAHTIMPVSIPLHGFYDNYGVALSVPCVIGKNGVEEIINVSLNRKEQSQLSQSVKVLKKYL